MDDDPIAALADEALGTARFKAVLAQRQRATLAFRHHKAALFAGCAPQHRDPDSTDEADR
jgi:hypothetical protein